MVEPMPRQLTHLTVVCPAYDEAANVPRLYARLRGALDRQSYDWDLLIIDDGSRDDTFAVAMGLCEQDPRVAVMALSRNFGHEAASTAGLDHAKGEAVVLMDADLQDPPEAIPLLVECWEQGYDIVTGRRRSRAGETSLKRTTSYLFYRLMRLISADELPKDTGDFRLLDRKVVRAFRECPEHNRFVRFLVSWTGFRQTEVLFDRGERHRGITKYSFRKQFELALGAIAAHSVFPLRLALFCGLLAIVVSLVAAARLFVGSTFGLLELVAVGLWFLGGVQCLLLGVLGEYIGLIYAEVRERPNYIVQRYVGVEPRDTSADNPKL